MVRGVIEAGTYLTMMDNILDRFNKGLLEFRNKGGVKDQLLGHIMSKRDEIVGFLSGISHLMGDVDRIWFHAGSPSYAWNFWCYAGYAGGIKLVLDAKGDKIGLFGMDIGNYKPMFWCDDLATSREVLENFMDIERDYFGPNDLNDDALDEMRSMLGGWENLKKFFSLELSKINKPTLVRGLFLRRTFWSDFPPLNEHVALDDVDLDVFIGNRNEMKMLLSGSFDIYPSKLTKLLANKKFDPTMIGRLVVKQRSGKDIIIPIPGSAKLRDVVRDHRKPRLSAGLGL